MTCTRTLLGLTLTLALATTPAWAAKHPKKPKAQETYAATESEDSVVAAQPSPRKLVKATVPAPTLKLNTKAEIAAFDAVPSDQAESLSQRLKIVDALIRRHGRAYDYRTMTIRNLQGVLAKLDGPATTQQVPAKAPEAASAPLPIPTEEDEVNGRDESDPSSEM